MTVISKNMGKKTLGIYIFSIAFSSIILGILLDKVWGLFHVKEIGHIMAHRGFIPQWAEITSSVMLAALIIYNALKRSRG